MPARPRGHAVGHGGLVQQALQWPEPRRLAVEAQQPAAAAVEAHHDLVHRRQLPQERQDRLREERGHHCAGGHRHDVVRAALLEAVVTGRVRREADAIAVAEGGSVRRRGFDAALEVDAAEAPEAIQEDVAPRLALGVVVEVLQIATAADAVMRAGCRAPARAGSHHLHQFGLEETLAGLARARADLVAGRGQGHEDGLTVMPAETGASGHEFLDGEFERLGHGRFTLAPQDARGQAHPEPLCLRPQARRMLKTWAPGDGSRSCSWRWRRPAALPSASSWTTGAPPAIRRRRAVALAKEQIGAPYAFGGSQPEVGFDCSGLVQWVYGRCGVPLPRSVDELAQSGRPVDDAEVKPGDLVFFAIGGHDRPRPCRDLHRETPLRPRSQDRRRRPDRVPQ